MFSLFATGVVDTGGKFATSINNTSGTGGKICGGVDIGGAPWLANISAKFQKIRNDPNVIFMGWGKMFHEKKT